MQSVDYAALQEKAREDGIRRTVVGIAVGKGKQLLLLQRRSDDFLPDVWELPGGHVEEGESIPDTVARELLEETGWVLEEIEEFIDEFDYPGEAGETTREWNFRVRAAMASALVHPEHQAAAWVGPEEIAGYDMTQEMRRTVARALARFG